jgi:ElaB/YqjD/DUF883 family membrane-anchored ribosome-binding protein
MMEKSPRPAPPSSEASGGGESNDDVMMAELERFFADSEELFSSSEDNDVFQKAKLSPGFDKLKQEYEKMRKKVHKSQRQVRRRTIGIALFRNLSVLLFSVSFSVFQRFCDV